MNNKLYLGIDLGDRTYSLDAVKWDVDTNIPVALPGQRGNMPILSAIGQTLSGEFRLLRGDASFDSSKLKQVLVHFKVKPSSVPETSPKIAYYKQGVLKMLELTLTQAPTSKTIRDLAIGCENITINIGYPTNWDERDTQLMQKILKDSVLGDSKLLERLYGKPVRVLLERESTAALIYARTAKEKLGINQQTKVLVLDFGSSTVNVTALTIGARNTLYNSGHNFFGGRLADCLIADYFLKRLTNEELRHMKDIDRRNQGVATSLLLLAACKAKEELTEQTTTQIYVDFLPDRAVRFTREEFDKRMNVPLAAVVHQFHLIPEEELLAFGTLSWREVLIQYLRSEQKMLASKGINPELVIATGGGSLLPETQRICNELFPKVAFMNASNATNIISRGLAQAAKRNDMSAAFNYDVEDFLRKKLPTLIRAEVPSLAEAISGDITDIMCDELIIPEMLKWRNGYSGYSTLNITTNKIAAACAGNDFSRRIQSNAKMQSAIRNWCTEKLGTSVAKALENICSKYNVKGFKLEELNVMKTPSVRVDGGDLLSTTYDVVGAIVGVVAGIIAASLSTSALIIVLEIIALFLPGLAALIAEIIAFIPGGLIILAGIAGVAVFKLIIKGWESVKEQVISGISGANIPDFCRKAVPESIIKNSINKKRSEIRTKIYGSIASGSNAQNISHQIHKSVEQQILKKLDEIRYVLEQ